jgi:hypothetical protein
MMRQRQGNLHMQDLKDKLETIILIHHKKLLMLDMRQTERNVISEWIDITYILKKQLF